MIQGCNRPVFRAEMSCVTGLIGLMALLYPAEAHAWRVELLRLVSFDITIMYH